MCEVCGLLKGSFRGVVGGLKRCEVFCCAKTDVAAAFLWAASLAVTSLHGCKTEVAPRRCRIRWSCSMGTSLVVVASELAFFFSFDCGVYTVGCLRCDSQCYDVVM